MNLILDVGCGQRPSGDVNVDLHPEPTGHRSGDQRKLAKALDTKKIPNFIKADAQYLPFRNETFNKVICRHTLEHIRFPIRTLKDLYRVSKRHVVVTVPHRLGDTKNKVLHIQKFNLTSLGKILDGLGWNYRMQVTKRRNIPHAYMPLISLPTEITVKIFKNLIWDCAYPFELGRY